MTVRPMTAEDKRVWLEALRSGSYTQGRTQLKRDGRYCCLGVANEVCDLGINNHQAFLRSYRAVPAQVMFLPTETQRLLSLKNDNQRWSFDQIADYIEANINPES